MKRTTIGMKMREEGGTRLPGIAGEWEVEVDLVGRERGRRRRVVELGGWRQGGQGGLQPVCVERDWSEGR